jgi:hypothetical protein
MEFRFGYPAAAEHLISIYNPDLLKDAMQGSSVDRPLERTLFFVISDRIKNGDERWKAGDYEEFNSYLVNLGFREERMEELSSDLQKLANLFGVNRSLALLRPAAYYARNLCQYATEVHDGLEDAGNEGESQPTDGEGQAGVLGTGVGEGSKEGMRHTIRGWKGAKETVTQAVTLASKRPRRLGNRDDQLINMPTDVAGHSNFQPPVSITFSGSMNG